MKYFIDTNIFLQALIKDNKEQSKNCIDFLKLVRKGKVEAFTSTIVLAEIAWTLLSFYNLSKKKTIKALKATIRLKNLKIIDNFDPFQAINLYEQHNKIKFVDTIIASLSEFKNNMVIVSFDKDFDDLKIKRKEPQEIVS